MQDSMKQDQIILEFRILI